MSARAKFEPFCEHPKYNAQHQTVEDDEVLVNRCECKLQPVFSAGSEFGCESQQCSVKCAQIECDDGAECEVLTAFQYPEMQSVCLMSQSVENRQLRLCITDVMTVSEETFKSFESCSNVTTSSTSAAVGGSSLPVNDNPKSPVNPEQDDITKLRKRWRRKFGLVPANASATVSRPVSKLVKTMVVTKKPIGRPATRSLWCDQCGRYYLHRASIIRHRKIAHGLDAKDQPIKRDKMLPSIACDFDDAEQDDVKKPQKRWRRKFGLAPAKASETVSRPEPKLVKTMVVTKKPVGRPVTRCLWCDQCGIYMYYLHHASIIHHRKTVHGLDVNDQLIKRDKMLPSITCDFDDAKEDDVKKPRKKWRRKFRHVPAKASETVSRPEPKLVKTMVVTKKPVGRPATRSLWCDQCGVYYLHRASIIRHRKNAHGLDAKDQPINRGK